MKFSAASWFRTYLVNITSVHACECRGWMLPFQRRISLAAENFDFLWARRYTRISW